MLPIHCGGRNEMEFFELKINFSIYLQLKTPNTTIKSLPKTSTKLKIPQNHPKKSKSIEPQRLKRNLIFFSCMFAAKTHYHWTHIIEWNSLTINLTIFVVGIATTNYFLFFLLFSNNFLSFFSNTRTEKYIKKLFKIKVVMNLEWTMYFLSVSHFSPLFFCFVIQL